jgi:hypothetical protein
LEGHGIDLVNDNIKLGEMTPYETSCLEVDGVFATISNHSNSGPESFSLTSIEGRRENGYFVAVRYKSLSNLLGEGFGTS